MNAALMGGSVRRKLMLVVLATTLIALLVAGLALLVYDFRHYERSSVDDLTAQAEIVARASAPAIQFNDPQAARENLALLAVRPAIIAAALYGKDGPPFAAWQGPGTADVVFPATAPASGHTVDRDRLILVHPVIEGGDSLGVIYLVARYGARQRIQDYLLILFGVLLASLAVATVLALWLQRSLTAPILSVSETARQVMERRDFSLRATRSTDDEVGYLVDAFNGMLAEVEQGTVELEAANRTLEHEMTERRAAEDALRAADRRKDEFLATLAHELRNPLAPIRNALAILSLPGVDADAATRARAILDRQLRQLIRLVDDLLDVSRITTGKLLVRKSAITLGAVLESSLETVRPFAVSRSQTLESRLPTVDVWLDGDATRLGQVFSNLLHNACKYTDPGGRIRLEASAEDGWATVSVTDDGMGLAPAMLPRVFEMFEQADTSIERRHGGLGVGLTLARRLVELHGGAIEARSDGLGRGSTFTVRLPCRPAGAGVTAPTAPADAGDAGPPRRILLVDDNLDFISTLATMLRADGHDVTVCGDAREALALAPQLAPDIAFIDIGMPGMNGYDLARALRAHPALARLVLVAVTGWGQEHDRRNSREAGFDRHLVKPVDWDDIRGLLSSLSGVSDSARAPAQQSVRRR